MLISRPLFLVGFARGGTNVLFNLLRSHPDLSSPRGELQQVFRGKRHDEPWWTQAAKLGAYLPVVLLEGEDVFSSDRWHPRRPLRPLSKRLVDRVLFREKLKARLPGQNRYVSEGREYTIEELRRTRLLCKNLNGLIFASRLLHDLYPDATFFALVRNGLAVCEGHARRGADLQRAAATYQRGCDRILEDAGRIPRFHLLRFEDLLERPLETIRRIYELADLDPDRVEKFRFQPKRVMRRDGRYETVDGAVERALRWCAPEELPKLFRTDVNDAQIARLRPEEVSIVVEHAGRALRHFGYVVREAS